MYLFMCQKMVLSKLEQVSNKGSNKGLSDFTLGSKGEKKNVYIFMSSLLFKPLQTEYLEGKLRQMGKKQEL